MNRPYDIIVYGATGYAVAGRNEQKLKLTTLVDSLDRYQMPCKLSNILVTTNSDEDLKHMASQTRLMLNTVGTLASNAHRTVFQLGATQLLCVTLVAGNAAHRRIQDDSYMSCGGQGGHDVK
ncbi:hypothetical protein AKAW_00197 [Aspergillus luchuensis IFO 4308]|nr:hypothetical protein AKAW_00197 [Aspergillus luchuensis IFO 4308]